MKRRRRRKRMAIRAKRYFLTEQHFILMGIIFEFAHVLSSHIKQ
jgi:hypothetical protein